MKSVARMITLICLGLLVISCGFLDRASDLIGRQIDRFSDSPTPTAVVVVSTPTMVEIADKPEEVLPPKTTPTATLAPPTPTPAPESLNPEGPYVLYSGPVGIWISNPDGTFLTQIFNDRFHNGLRSAVSPDGSRMALVRRDDTGFELILLDLPGGQQTFVARLLEGFGEDYEEPIEDPRVFVEQVFWNYNSVAWQPGQGDLLAFVGAINGETTDLYVYDTRTQEITQLSDEPSYAVLPRWSPDGEYLLYYGVGWESPIGGALVEHNRLYGAWTVNPQDGQLIPMPKTQATRISFVGWLDDQHYLACDDFVLNSVDVVTGGQTALMECPAHLNEISLSPTNGALLLSFRADYSENFDEGLFYFASPFSTPQKIMDQFAWEVVWLSESEVFDAYPEALISSDGQSVYFPPIYESSYLPAVSPQGYQAWKVYKNRQPSVEVFLPSADCEICGEWLTILSEPVETLLWDPIDGETLLIIGEDGTLWSARYPDFKPQAIGQFGGSAWGAIYVP